MRVIFLILMEPFDSYKVMLRAFLYAFSRQNITIPKDKAYYLMRVRSLGEAFNYFKNDKLDLDKLYKDFKDYEIKHLNEFSPFEGANELLEKITIKRKKSFVLTHRDNVVYELLRQYDLAKYFTDIVTSNNKFKRKPAPDSLNYLFQK